MAKKKKIEIKPKKTIKCKICKKSMALGDLFPVNVVRSSVIEIIKSKFPSWSPGGYICFSDLHKYRTEYLETILEQDKGELSNIDQEVIKSLRKQAVIAKNINKEFETELTFGQRMADKVAEFGGSWTFLSLFAVVLFIWVIINSVVLLIRPFDPYPFILLNLFLSCLAAIQAPVIMMSQNRQSVKDRLRSEEDYKVNLKSELMIKHLNLKIDQLLSNQWQRLLEIQHMQIELLEEAISKKGKK